ncbi:MAG: hypothetical protein JXB32_02345 [Deltaproteobacteria bacterium]|nr:hypothetical protein [Deltaproteobacteria bacterium]
MPTKPTRPTIVSGTPRTTKPTTTAARTATPTASPASRTLAQARTALPALRQEAERLLAVVAQAKTRIGADFYRMSAALTELLDRKLHAALGYETFGAMLQQRRLMSPAAASKLIAIYRSIPRQTALQLGPERAYEWLQLLREEAGPDAGPDDVRRLADERTEVQGRPVADLTRQEIVELRQRVQARREAGRRDPSAAVAHRLARALAQRLEHAGAADARVAARFARSGWRLRVDLDLTAGQALLAALS